MAGSAVSKPVIGAVAGVGAGLLPGAFPSGVGLSHVSEGFVWPHGGTSVLERGVGVRDFSDVPKPFRSFESECSGYVWDASVSGWSGSAFTHGGFSFGVTPRARWSFGGSVDLNAVADGFRVPVGGVGARTLGESVGVEDLVLGSLVAPPGSGSGSLGFPVGAGVSDLSSFRFDYDGRGGVMSSVEVSNVLAVEQSSYWLSRVGGVDVVSPPLVGESPDVVAARVKRLRSKERADGGVRPRLMGVRREVEIMSFIGIFGWVDVRATMLLLGVSTRATALKYLKGLQSRGCIEAVDVAGAGGHRVWVGTRVGLDEFGVGGGAFKRSSLGNMEFPHRVLVTYVGALLWCGSFDVLNLGTGVWGGRSSGGSALRGFNVVSDRQINGSLQGLLRGNNALEMRDYLIAERARLLREWRAGGGSGVGPECFGGNEWMWAVLSAASLAIFHVPDIVAILPRGENGEARSIAVEVERGSSKSKKKLVEILEQYRDDRSVFSKVVWLCTSDTMVRRVNKWATEEGVSDRIMAYRLERPEGGVFDNTESVFTF